MLGAIIGDIIGSRWEFSPTNDYNFELFSDKNGFTDDTICTIAVADAILHNSEEYGKYIHNWCNKYQHPMGGYGGRFAQWVASSSPKPYNSFGNGSAMRVSPIGWRFNNDEVMSQAQKSAECTHNHIEGIKGAQSVACAIYGCREFIRKQQNNTFTKEEIRDYALRQSIGMYGIDSREFKIDIERYRNKFDETCQGTVPVALWIIINSTSYEDAVRKAVSLGGDADTLGAIVGSIAKALWGIPEWIENKALTYLPEEMKNIIIEFRNRYIK
ncbi:MAG: ADP-ribosylglycohydrolase family protein [Bacteroidia bacterium]|nr:ADP-ribosylglycohydrolase family protein [Bacteroidia bacterium]